MRAGIDIDPDILLEMGLRGLSNKEQARILGVPTRTLTKKLEQLQRDKDEVTQYRTIQSIELTKLQAEILDNITPDKIANASLRDLVSAFKILKDKELAIEGKPSEIKGLVGYLIEMEKKEFELKHLDAVDVTPEGSSDEDEKADGGNGDKSIVIKDITDKDYLPNL